MKGGWVKTEGLYEILIFFESIVKNTLESPRNLAENPLENPGKEFHFTVGHPVNILFKLYICICNILVAEGLFCLV